MFSMNVPFTPEDGVSIPIEVSNPATGLFHKARGFLATGSMKCHISEQLANHLNFGNHNHGYSAIVILKNSTRIEIPIVFYQQPFMEHDAILGLPFLNWFSLMIDGPNRRATISIPS